MFNWYEIQTKLKELGFYSGKIDGVRGPLTNQAIVAFKKSIGFRARDLYTDITHQALMGTTVSSNTVPWMDYALKVKGLHERHNYSQLKSWFSKSVAWIDPREIPWCGAFVATCFSMTDPKIRQPANPLGARQWGAFGFEVAPRRGAVLTFWRGSPGGWQGHVGFYFGEDDTAFHVLGGNQSDAVTVTRVAKTRLLQSRWPEGYAVNTDRVAASGDGKLSTNEA